MFFMIPEGEAITATGNMQEPTHNEIRFIPHEASHIVFIGIKMKARGGLCLVKSSPIMSEQFVALSTQHLFPHPWVQFPEKVPFTFSVQTD